MGEGWHNNHHHYMASARQGFFWWEVDITFYVLRVLSWFRHRLGSARAPSPGDARRRTNLLAQPNRAKLWRWTDTDVERVRKFKQKNYCKGRGRKAKPKRR